MGYCHPCTSPYTNSRDFMRVVLAKNSKCRGSDRNGRSSCTRCYYNRLHWQCGECTLRENRCAHLGQESCDSNHVFCGKSDKGVQVKVRYCETRKGVVEVDFVADETRRTKMFRCSFVDLNEVCLWRPVCTFDFKFSLSLIFFCRSGGALGLLAGLQERVEIRF